MINAERSIVFTGTRPKARRLLLVVARSVKMKSKNCFGRQICGVESRSARNRRSLSTSTCWFSSRLHDGFSAKNGERELSDVSDQTLIEQLRQGDRSAFEIVIERNQRSVYGYLRARLQQTSDADDMMQEVFLRFYLSQARFDSSALIRPWLLGIARNLLREHVRDVKRRKEVAWTEPSHSREWQPPMCRLKGSSFDPQLLTVHGQPAGPPVGVLLLLMIPIGEVIVFPAASNLGPETPLPVSPSAQRFGQVLAPPGPHICVVSQPLAPPITWD